MKKSAENIAKEIRKILIKMHQKGSHLGSSLSIVDILAVLYFDTMNIDSFDDPNRDRFILSKGHAVSALYAALAKKGFIDESLFEKHITNGNIFYGHPVRGSFRGIETSSGTLGHGLPQGVGMAYAAEKDKKNYKIYILMGDGECQEGSVWEAAMLASRLKLDNIIAIIDANNLQGFDIVENIQPISTFKAKWEAFGWCVKEVDGNNCGQLKKILTNVPFKKNIPSLIIAHTIKGKGIKEIENKLEWHYLSVPKEKVNLFIKEIEENK